MFPPSSFKKRTGNANALIADLLEAHGWHIDRSPKYGINRPDLIVRKAAQRFVVEVKVLAEGRADRVIPMLSQAILQAQAQANAFDVGTTKPLAVIFVESASHSLAKHIESFSEKYVPNVAVGLVSKGGLRYFRGAGLEELNAEPEEEKWQGSSLSNQPINLFSDLN